MNDTCLFNEDSIYVKLAKEKMKKDKNVIRSKIKNIPIIHYDSVELLLNIIEIHEKGTKVIEQYFKNQKSEDKIIDDINFYGASMHISDNKGK